MSKPTPQAPTSLHPDTLAVLNTLSAGLPPSDSPGTTLQLQRPGLTESQLRAAGIRRVSAEAAKDLVGKSAPGILIPYYDVKNASLLVCQSTGLPWCRLRLDTPEDGQKYHQRQGTTQQVYLPPQGHTNYHGHDYVVITEGEFKALALMGLGIPAIGSNGFHGFRGSDAESLHPTISEVLSLYPNIKKVYFLGDTDTALNFHFAQAACALRKLLSSKVELALPRLPFDGPKGIDDSSAALGAGFMGAWSRAVQNAICVTPQSDPSLLALDLMERAAESPAPTERNARCILAKKAAMTAALCERAVQREISNLINQWLGTKRSDFGDMVRLAKLELQNNVTRKIDQGDGDEKDNTVLVSQQSGALAGEILRKIANKVYFHQGEICHVADSRLSPLNKDMLMVMIDRPEVIRPVAKQDGMLVPAFLPKTTGELVRAEAQRDPGPLRHVRAVANVTTLVSAPTIDLVGVETSPCVLLKPGQFCERTGRLVLAGNEEFQLGWDSDTWNSMTVPKARDIIERFFRDYAFATEWDKLRAISFMISPALAMGGFLGEERAPFFWIFKTHPGTGATLLCKAISALYKVTPVSISRHDEKGLREGLGKWLLKEGGAIAFLDNVSGKSLARNDDLAAFLTSSHYGARALYADEKVDVRHSVLCGTSNGASLGKDNAERTVAIQLIKQAPDYSWTRWDGQEPGPDAYLKHIEIHRNEYLAAVYHLIQEVLKDKALPGRKVGFRFVAWERICAAIVELLYPGRCLLEGMDAQRQMLMDSDFDYIRRLLVASMDPDSGVAGQMLCATQLADLAITVHLVDVPTSKTRDQVIDSERKRLGGLLRKLFPEPGDRPFDNGTLIVQVRDGWSESRHDARRYRVLLNGGDAPVETNTWPSPAPSKADVIREYMHAYDEEPRFIPTPSGLAKPVNSVHRGVATSEKARVAEQFVDLEDDEGPVAITMETVPPLTSKDFDPWDAQILRIHFFNGRDQHFVVDTGNPELLHRALETIKERVLVGHDLQRLLAVLRRQFSFIPQQVYCTELASRVLENGKAKISHKLEDCVARHLMRTTTAGSSSLNVTGGDILDLRVALEARLAKESLGRVAELEMKTLLVSVEMWHHGILVDIPLLEKLRHEALDQCRVLLVECQTVAGSNYMPTNNDIIRAKLNELEKAGRDQEVQWKLMDDSFNWRKARALASAVQGYLNSVKSDGRLHPTFFPLGAATGRFSCQKPNVQGVPRGPVREAFRAAPGNQFLILDFDQVELRVAAAESKDAAMLEVYRFSRDLHAMTASKILGIPETEVTKSQRQLGKTVNFGMLNGGSPHGLREFAMGTYGVQMTDQEAENYHRAFFEAYPQLKAYIDKAKRDSVDCGKVTTRFGRRRLLPEFVDSWDRYTALINTPIQGGAADGMKLALRLIRQKLPQELKIGWTVHDEAIIEGPAETIDAWKDRIAHLMEEGMSSLYPEIPFKVTATISQNWGGKE